MLRNSSRSTGRVGRTRRRAIDGLVLDRKDFWIVVASDDEDPVGLLRGADEGPGEAPLRVCRAVLDRGFVLIGDADLAQCAFLSELLASGEAGTA